MRKIIITQYDQAADERVSYGGIKWLRKWDVSIQCDSLEEALSLRKSLEDEKSEVDSLKARLFEMQEAAKNLALGQDPCPGCPKGHVCRTPNCGRLALPVKHPFRIGVNTGLTLAAESLDRQADLAAEELDRKWAKQMAAAVRAMRGRHE